MRLYSSVEVVVTMCLVYKIWWLLYSYPPLRPPPPNPPPNKKRKKKKISWTWILCQNSLTRELKIRFVGLVL